MKQLVFAATLALSATVLNAAPITTTVSAPGNGFNGSLTLMNDGIFPGEGSVWNGNATVSWRGLGKVFTFDFGNLYQVEDVRLSVDNNDSYALEYSLDNAGWTSLFTILPAHGEIGWGMDTISTVLGDAEYVAQIDFASVEARYVRIKAIDGDNSYSIGEVQFSGTRVEPVAPAAVPEPGMLALFAAALGAGVLTRRRRHR